MNFPVHIPDDLASRASGDPRARWPETSIITAQLRIQDHLRLFEGLTENARSCLKKGEVEACAAWVQLAAHYAWFHPTGFLASERLETMLAQIAGIHCPGQSAVPERPFKSPQRVLHVLSEAYGIGGHTRLVWRWIRADSTRTHSVILTRQMDADIPTQLSSAVAITGGTARCLDRQRGGILARARALQALAADFDHVIVHTHPWDVVPLIAFHADKGRPALTLMNKDDHVFWLGASLPDQVAQMRYSGWRLSESRRGIAGGRCRLLPLPLEIEPSAPRREEARRILGIPGDTILLLSVASSYKYESVGEHLTHLIMPLFEKRANILLLVLGAEPKGIWTTAFDRTGGRIRALGKRNDARLYYRAADIYLDSFPLNSLTSALEAGTFGTPLVSYCPYSSDAEVLCTDDEALTEASFRPRTPDEYRATIERLLDDGALRRTRGMRTRTQIIASHTGAGWMRFLEDLYARVPPRSTPSESFLADRRPTELELVLTSTYASAGLSRDLKQDIRNYLGLFPLATRMSIWAKEFRFSPKALPGCLLSDGQRTRIRLLGRRAVFVSPRQKAPTAADAAIAVH